MSRMSPWARVDRRMEAGVIEKVTAGIVFRGKRAF